MEPTPVFLPGESHGQRASRATAHGVTRVRHNLVTQPLPPPGVDVKFLHGVMKVTQMTKSY